MLISHLSSDHLLGNPYVQPPLPIDWQVVPTHPVHRVPYYLATLWDASKMDRGSKRPSGKQRNAGQGFQGVLPRETADRVPKALKETMKRSSAARNMLQELEVEVRAFVQAVLDSRGLDASAGNALGDSADEFVLVNADLSLQSIPAPENERLVFQGPEGDQSASFSRWLVHSLGDYYGLDTWSITIGDPARREAYVGIRGRARVSSKSRHVFTQTMPRPLWTRV